MDLYICNVCLCVDNTSRWCDLWQPNIKMCEAIAGQPSSEQPASKQRANEIKFYGIINLKCSLTWIKYTAEVIC